MENEIEIDDRERLDETDETSSKVSYDDFKRKKNKRYNKIYTESFIDRERGEVTLLPTVQVMVSVEGKDSGPVRALIDTGAQPNLVSHQLAERLQLRKMQATRQIVGINGEPFHIKYWSKIKVRPWFSSNIAIEQEFLILPREGPLRPMLVSSGLGYCEAKEIDGLPLADPEFWKEGPADLLLGCKFVVEMFGSIMTRQPSGLFSMKTTFGRVMLGQRRDSLRVKDEKAYVVCLDNKQMHEALKRLWVLDEINPPPVRSREEELVERNFVDTYRRDRDGRFIVTIPLREAWREIGTNELTARRRFFALERKLERDPELKEKYVDFMREYESKGHMTPVVGTTSRAKMTYHIPHHCVTKKFRVVFDASCKTTMGVSLNEVQMVGEKLQKDLHEILMRFRRHRIAISADIKMMFRMVKIAKEQWDLQRIYWRESPQERLKEYWLTVVTYGMASSAHNAVRALIQCAKDAEADFPRASKIIREDFYMDDCTTGADSEIEAIRLSKDIDHILKGAGFELRKWNSNSKALVKDMNYEQRDSVVFREDEGTSILGLKWLLAKDQFTFEVKTPITESMMTKRKIVSCVAQLYDPNGYISPVTILGKILIQDVWRSKADWDDELATDILERWKELWREITCLEQFRIERWIGTSPGVPIEIHGFSDASEKAYGAVIYVRTEHPNGEIWSTLLQAKTRVAPLKTVTIPRLELAAAELLGRLVENVKETMEWKEIEYTLWTDSVVVLHWVNKQPCELKTFVANRVASIQTNTEIDRWRHVGTKENPADLLSRGIRAAELVKSELWLHGPQWLRQPRSQWKSEKFVPNVSDGGREEMKVMTVISVDEELSITTRKTRERVPVHEYVSTLEKATNVIGYVLRFTEAIKRKKSNGKKKRRGKMRRRSVRQKRKRGSRPIQLTSEEKEKAIEYLLRKELQKAKESWHRKESLDFLAAKGTEWRFMTPAAPHQGGIYEAAVKSMKFHLTRVIGAKILTYEQLLTLTAGVEAILNSRPLQAISDDPNDLQALTPGHFLVGEPLVLPLPFVTGEISNSHGARLWREKKTMLTHFWNRWREEYLVTLIERMKWRRERHGLQIGQLCIIKSENFPPSAWALGRIKRLIEGKDGLVRSVEVQTATNQLTRPVQKICILPNGE
ncbi:uncharacterized protein LOC129945032 [Eupeodes corollae]|uniref:uncharacterized protein LOC129945032 n=1 Tax=Eupeodes corollae TaxID=290404 RepID=UPI00249080E5|nr:uncharacterized protein LOC129945032 [Eupeodes corollae]